MRTNPSEDPGSARLYEAEDAGRDGGDWSGGPVTEDSDELVLLGRHR